MSAVIYNNETGEVVQFRCPGCGKYLTNDPDGFYDSDDKRDKPDPVTGLTEMIYGYIAPFCDESCADRFHGRVAKVQE